MSDEREEFTDESGKVWRTFDPDAEVIRFVSERPQGVVLVSVEWGVADSETEEDGEIEQ